MFSVSCFSRPDVVRGTMLDSDAKAPAFSIPITAPLLACGITVCGVRPAHDVRVGVCYIVVVLEKVGVDVRELVPKSFKKKCAHCQNVLWVVSPSTRLGDWTNHRNIGLRRCSVCFFLFVRSHMCSTSQTTVGRICVRLLPVDDHAHAHVFPVRSSVRRDFLRKTCNEFRQTWASGFEGTI